MTKPIKISTVENTVLQSSDPKLNLFKYEV